MQYFIVESYNKTTLSQFRSILNIFPMTQEKKLKNWTMGKKLKNAMNRTPFMCFIYFSQEVQTELSFLPSFKWNLSSYTLKVD